MRKLLQTAEIDWDEQGQPSSRLFNDVYFYCSKTDKDLNGLEESRYVFLQKNQLQERWEKITRNNEANQSFVIGETGFGTGLNFLAAWDLWQKTVCNTPARESRYLHYISSEKHPLTSTDLQKALALWPDLSHLSQHLLDKYPKILTPGFFYLCFPESNLSLTLIFDDALDGFKQCLQSQHPNFQKPFGAGVDAWFLDGFAPRCNPEMWNEDLFKTLAALSHDQTTLATFTAVGDVQRQLKAVGFTIKKVPGFANKREMITAEFQSPTTENLQLKTSSHSSKFPIPWSFHNLDKKFVDENTAIVIGAGLAGCHTARALADKGWRVHLVDEQKDIANAASGNAHGIVYGKLSADDDPLAEFNLSALLFAEQHYRYWWREKDDVGQACGILQLAYNDKETVWWKQCKNYFQQTQSDPTAVQFLSPDQASAVAGTKLDFNACYFPNLGWINPQLLCRYLIQHPSISLITDTRISNLQQRDRLWSANSSDGKNNINAAVIVIATAEAALQFNQCQQLPLKTIRGQVTYLEHEPLVPNLKTVLCGEAYITPDTQQTVKQSLGASFNLGEKSLEIRAEDHQYNLQNVANILPAQSDHINSIKISELTGRTGFRCTTPDYLPIVGPVHDHKAFTNDYALLRKNAKASLHTAGNYHPGLFINVGHGSRGLCYTPLCAQLLAAQINGDPLPISQRLMEALHPGRFTIRDLVRRKI